jgi:SHS family lactate transporter-like MFS transporter
VINLGVVPKVASSWRSLYFIGAGFSCLAALVRACLPESQQFILAREEAKKNNMSSGAQSKAFAREIGVMLKTNWIRCIWAICMMTGKSISSLGEGADI